MMDSDGISCIRMPAHCVKWNSFSGTCEECDETRFTPSGPGCLEVIGVGAGVVSCSIGQPGCDPRLNCDDYDAGVRFCRTCSAGWEKGHKGICDVELSKLNCAHD